MVLIHLQKAKGNFSNFSKALQRINTESDLNVLLAYFFQGVQQHNPNKYGKDSGKYLQEQKSSQGLFRHSFPSVPLRVWGIFQKLCIQNISWRVNAVTH